MLMNSTSVCSASIVIHFWFVGLVGSEDGHEELLAAVKGVINSGINLTKYYLYLQSRYFSSW